MTTAMAIPTRTYTAARVLSALVVAAGLLAAGSGRGDTPEQILNAYAEQARAEDPAFLGFSAERGEAFYREPHVIKGVIAYLMNITGASKGELLSPRRKPIGGVDDD